MNKRNASFYTVFSLLSPLTYYQGSTIQNPLLFKLSRVKSKYSEWLGVPNNSLYADIKEGAEGLTHGSFLNVVPNGSHDLPQAPALLSRLNDDFDFPLLADHIRPSVTHTNNYSLHVYEHLNNVYLYQAEWSARYTMSWAYLPEKISLMKLCPK
jgi:hypothetical protein